MHDSYLPAPDDDVAIGFLVNQITDSGSIGSNWADSYSYGAASLFRPGTIPDLQDAVAAAPRIRALGSRHSFTSLADTSGILVSLDALPAFIDIDEQACTVTVAAGLRYGDVATTLHERGWALHNLASLPHISIAGAIATGTHGSGDGNGNLATAVAAIEVVTADGELVTISRSDADFDGAVVSLGALGILTSVTLDIEPTFDVRQDIYQGLAWDDLLGNLDTVTSSAYSVSVFTNWLGDSIETVWTKSRMDAAAPPAHIFGATPQIVDRHPLPELEASTTTVQGGIPGPWSDRLAHFKLEYTPSNGEELQSEYLVPRHNAVAAIEVVRSRRQLVAPLLLVSEIRTMTADSLWLSGSYGTDAVAIHFTWKKLPSEIAAATRMLEAELLPLGARPHWGKVFSADAAALAPLYPRFDDFRALVARYDPERTFTNAFLEKHLGL